MKLLNLFVLFRQSHSLLLPTTKICKDCRHFIGNDLECGKFGDINLVTGKATYHSARTVRGDEKKCGEKAVYFEENHFKIITVPYYFVKDWGVLFLSSSLIATYIIFITHVTFHK